MFFRFFFFAVRCIAGLKNSKKELLKWIMQLLQENTRLEDVEEQNEELKEEMKKMKQRITTLEIENRKLRGVNGGPARAKSKAAMDTILKMYDDGGQAPERIPQICETVAYVLKQNKQDNDDGKDKA